MATQAEALAEARKLQAAIQAYGVKCVIDLRQGASSSGWMNPKDRWAGELSHHIVSRRSHGLTRFYQLCRDGREDVPGPLCNGYMGWDMVYRIITMGIANHSGKGGPLTLAGRTIPKDNGRYYLWGTEFEGGMIAEEWTPEFHDAMARVNAGILDWQSRPTDAHGEHLTWAPGRKNDRLGYTATEGRRRIEYVRGKGSGSIAPPPAPVVIAPPASKPTAPAPLLVDDHWGSFTTTALQRQLRTDGHYGGLIDGDFGPMTKRALQSWLKGLGVYGGSVDGDFGPMTRRALQNLLRASGFYTGLIDGDFGRLSTRALQTFLNSRIHTWKG